MTTADATAFDSYDAPASTPGRWRRVARALITWRNAWLLARLLLIAVPIYLASLIAYHSPYDGHADEKHHLNAFQYIERHWTPPEMGSHEVTYSPMGWSRVFTGEIVYPAFGTIGRLANGSTKASGPQGYVFYRFCNVGLLAFTLWALCFTRSRTFNFTALAAMLICIPQVIYIFAYANSDGWGVAMNALLFAQTAVLVERPAAAWGWWRPMLIAITALAVMLSKSAFTIGLIIPIAMLLACFCFTWRQDGQPRRAIVFAGAFLLLPLMGALVVAAHVKPSMGPHRAEFAERERSMRNLTAMPGESPSQPSWGMTRGRDGWTYATLMNTQWITDYWRSFYGQFGGWSVSNDREAFARTTPYAAAAIFLNALAMVVYQRRLPRALLIGVLLAIPLMVANFYGSMWHTLTIDYQPQGRYQFPSLVPLFCLFAGAMGIEGRVFRLLHAAAIVPLLYLSMSHLAEFGAYNDGWQ